MKSTIRPRGVWAILVLYSCSLVWFLFKIWRGYSEPSAASGAVTEYLKDPAALTATVIGLVLTLSFLVTLFRMRRVALAIYTAYIALAVCSLLWAIFFTTYLSNFPGAPLAGVLVALLVMVIPVQIHVYLRALVREGVLS